MLDMTKLAALGLDTEEGLAYCADDPEFYEEMLSDYVTEGEKRMDAMRRAFSARDWADYRIQVHSVKSTSRMIGAAELSEKALALENAAKASDESAIESSHDAFLDEYGALVHALRDLLA